MYNPQLDTFIRVAEAGSFSKAAQESFITPTAVIKQMNLLESRPYAVPPIASGAFAYASRQVAARRRPPYRAVLSRINRTRPRRRAWREAHYPRGSVAHDAQHAAHEAVAEGEGTLSWHEPSGGHV